MNEHIPSESIPNTIYIGQKFYTCVIWKEKGKYQTHEKEVYLREV